MGYLIEYKCPECSFKRELHEGSGRAAFAKNYMCKDCRDITSVLIMQARQDAEDAKQEAEDAREDAERQRIINDLFN